MVFLAGFGLSLSLIVAIGAQNAFVLRQGLTGRHVFAVCLCCALSDVLLIGAGIAGMGRLIQAWPEWVAVLRWAGAAFLSIYAWRSAARACAPDHALTPDSTNNAATLKQTLGVCLALTWLNPHVYIDTLLLLGSIAAAYSPQRLAFGAGAVSASIVFFFTLGYGARLLRPVFARPLAWRCLDGAIALIMATVAIEMITRGA